MSNSGSNPATGGESELALPVAAIVCLAVGGYVMLIVIIILVRYFLVSRGICECGSWCAKSDEDAQSCACCAELAECCNCCKSPTVTSCLDSICPNRKRMGCIELLLCQCCGSQGAEGLCASCYEYGNQTQRGP
ncbi:uncharacterized protein LOC124151867 isoform X2 [Haliotis rufescens]|uniref:uncharacterized protein LOC124151867 isoform X2 n=1 Tax=Haliotis rufescens TaxID=6454 RepID=UPI001EAFDCB3|nr:uncharacterized protein LOC124151867 isoform X2 [Haliotis rufescens]